MGLEKVLQVVCQARKGKRAGVAPLLGQNIRDRRLKDRCKSGGKGNDKKYQKIDLPNLRHPGQASHAGGPRQIQADQKAAARQAVGQPADQGRDAHVGHHLQRQGRAQDRAGLPARKVEGQEGEGDAGEAGAGKRDNLRREEAAG